MSRVKISQLTELTTPDSNTKNTFILVTDVQSGSAVSKKMSLFTLDTALDVSQGQANLAFNHANAAFANANAGLAKANSSFANANGAFAAANAAYIHANSAFAAANLANAGVVQDRKSTRLNSSH